MNPINWYLVFYLQGSILGPMTQSECLHMHSIVPSAECKMATSWLSRCTPQGWPCESQPVFDSSATAGSGASDK